MSHSLPDLTQALLDAARKAGADQADAIARQGTSLSIDVRAGKLEQAERSEGAEVGLRVLVGQRQACISASDLRPESLTTMAERAVAMARVAPEDPWIGLADPAQLSDRRDASGLDMADPTPEPSPKDLEDDALRAEAAALAIKGVSQVQAAAAGYGATDTCFAATNGFAGGYRRTGRSLSCVAIAGSGTGMERDYDHDSRIYQADLRSADDIGRTAGERAIASLGATRPPSGAWPVLYDERVAGSLIDHLLGAVNGLAISRGSSFLRGELGQTILPETLSLTEDPLRPRGGATRPFDGEGLPTARRAIVENGVLKSWTLDLASARKLGMSPTGNGGRGLSSPPSPSTWNVELTQGPLSRAELMREMGTGLLVTSLLGSTINPNTGDYSRGASGFWVENGEITRPVNEFTIAGNLRDMFRTLIPANDARPWFSRVVPSILVEGLTLAGS